jgi:DNA-binding Lrp family transcriptional regulator
MANEESPGRFDELDRRLIEQLQADPREAYAALGARLGVTGMTVANRLQRIRNAGLLTIRAEPNLSEFGLATEVLGLIQADVGGLDAVESTLRVSPYVLRVHRVTGEFDLTFDAAFPSEVEMGVLVRDVQSLDGVRRLVVYHRMQTAKSADGWQAVWAETAPPAEQWYELAPGTVVPRQLEDQVGLAAHWVSALAAADVEAIRQLSAPDIVFTILPPHPSAGTFEGLDGVERQAGRTRRAYNRLWYRIIAVTEGRAPYRLVIDALSPVEDRKGQVGTAFSRMAFAFANGKVSRVLSLGQMDLPDVPPDAV